MESTYSPISSLPLPDPREADNFMIAIYGPDNPDGSKSESITEALLRYMGNRGGIGNNQLACMAGIDRGDISRYLNNKRTISKEHLCLFCIALRLMTCQQKYLFDLLKEPIPGTIGKPDERECIIKHYMDGCFYDENMTVAHCIAQLDNAKEKGAARSVSCMEGGK